MKGKTKGKPQTHEKHTNIQFNILDNPIGVDNPTIGGRNGEPCTWYQGAIQVSLVIQLHLGDVSLLMANLKDHWMRRPITATLIKGPL